MMRFLRSSLFVTVCLFYIDCAGQEKLADYQIIRILDSAKFPLTSEDYNYLNEATVKLLNSQSIEIDKGGILFSWGAYYQRNFQQDSAIIKFRKSIDYFHIQNDSFRLARAYYELAKNYTDIDEYLYSTKLLHNSLEIFESLEDSINIGETNNLIGNNYYYSGDGALALDYYQKAIEMNRGRPELQSKYLTNMGSMYYEMGQYENAEKTYLRSLNLVEGTDYKIRIADTYNGLGILMEKIERLDEAYQYYRKGYALALALEDKISITQSIQNFAYYFLSTGNYDSSEYYANISLKNSDSLNNFLFRNNAFEVLHEVYFRTGRYEKAYELLKITKEEEDSIFTLNSARQLNAIQAEYGLKQKEIEISQKVVELSQAQTILAQKDILKNALIGCLVLLSFIVLSVIRSQRLKAKANELLKLKNAEIEKKNAEIETMEAARSKWFINISHDLRTPLTLVKGPLSQLVRSKNMDEYELEMTNIAYRNVEMLQNLVSEILDLSKLSDGAVKLDKKAVDLVTLVSDSISLFESATRALNINLNFEYHKDENILLTIDKSKIQKIVVNLISNAIKFSPNGGDITAKIEELEDNIIISITDNGIGISPKDIPHIFDRFYQASNADESSQGGFGIGLALSREIAHMHEGDLKVSSKQGKGSTFQIILPSKLKLKRTDFDSKSTVKNEIKETLGSSNRKKYSVLLADDNIDMRAYIQGFLADDYSVIHVRDGQEGLERLEAGIKPDIIISDIMMPRIDGVAFAKKVKENQEWRGIPFIILTAIEEESKRLDMLRIGVDEYIYKPFNPEELLIRIENLIANHYERKLAIADSEETSFGDKLITKLEEEIRSNISDPDFNVLRLAEATSMSERQLYRYLKQATGFTPANYIREIRLQKAFELIRKQVYQSTSELAYAVGFQHSSYFTSVFRKRFGKNPSEFIKEFQD